MNCKFFVTKIQKIFVSGKMYEKYQKKMGKGSWTLEKEIELKDANVISK